MESIQKAAMTKTSDRFGSFVPADVLTEFCASFLDKELCRSFVIGSVSESLPPICPNCKEKIKRSSLPSFWERKRIKCWNCGKYFTALTGTFLSGCHFDFREIILLTFMLALKVPDKQIALTLEISEENVRLWRHRFEAIEQSKKIGSGE